MEKNLNVFAAVCKEYNRETNSIIGIYNKVEIENDRMDLCVFTGINYVGRPDNQSDFALDYYLKCIEDKDDTGQNGKKIPLYGMSGRNHFKDKEMKYMANSIMFSEERNIYVPCSGIYELQVYSTEESLLKEKNSKERYKKYQDDNQLPQSVFRFEIVKETVD